MTDDPDYHRTLNGGLQKLPYSDFEARKSSFVKAGAITAFRMQHGSLVLLVALLKKDQDFEQYATDWEKSFSTLCSGGTIMDPVVDANMTVVGHYGWVGQG